MNAEYTVKAERSGGSWAITVSELPGVFGQARRRDQIEATARDAIALYLDVPKNSFVLSVQERSPSGEAKAQA
jgi:predicted RNase H-like HicB family nuclease